MSLIFSNIKLLSLHKFLKDENFAIEQEPIQSSNISNPGYILQQRSDSAIHKVLLGFHNYETEETNQIKFYSNNERFIQNSLKQNLLLNVQDFVPKIFFWFRPAYCVQLSVRYMVKLLLGEQNEKIEKVISTNPSLYKFFLNCHALGKYICTGECLQSPYKFGKQFMQECVLALIEYMNIQKETDLVFVPLKVLELLGDS